MRHGVVRAIHRSLLLINEDTSVKALVGPSRHLNYETNLGTVTATAAEEAAPPRQRPKRAAGGSVAAGKTF